MKKFLLPACTMLLYIACTSSPENTAGDKLSIDSALAVKNSSVESVNQPVLLGTFEGIIPCADCIGLKTELTLYQDPANAENNNYILKETYLDGKTGDTTFTSNGKWDIVSGIKSDPAASVYLLNYDRPDESRAFLKKGDSAIVLLDKEQNIIQSSLNFTLRKK